MGWPYWQRVALMRFAMPLSGYLFQASCLLLPLYTVSTLCCRDHAAIVEGVATVSVELVVFIEFAA